MSVNHVIEAFERARALDAPLAERLGIYANALREFNAPIAEATDRLVERLKLGELAQGAPSVGERMPPFLLPDHAGNLIGLEEILAKGPTAVSFVRGHWCPYCRIVMTALAAAARDAEAIGAQIVAITPERQEYATRLRDEANAPFPVLTDIDNGYALSLQLTYWLGEELKTYMRSRDIDLDRAQGNESWFVPVPATFIVGRDGIIVQRHVDPDYRNRMETTAILEALRGLV